MVHLRLEVLPQPTHRRSRVLHASLDDFLDEGLVHVHQQLDKLPPASQRGKWWAMLRTIQHWRLEELPDISASKAL